MSTERKLAVILMSGGMDSAVCAALAKDSGYEIAALHMNYGQRTEQRELKAFRDLAAYYNARAQLIVDMSHFSVIGGSSLTDPNIEVTKADLDSSEIPTSYVPFRNANIMAIGVSWAEVLQADALFIGAMEQDSSGYPDCRQVFFDAFQQVINYGTKPGTKIEIVTPIINMTKADIIKRGLELDVPFELTWSCYQGAEEACGICDSCALRLRGFQQAGIDDPLPYKIKPNYTNFI